MKNTNIRNSSAGFTLPNFFHPPKFLGKFRWASKNLGGFTLIEILIVVAIIGILASVVLVGLGPLQRQGRDARRISDLKQVQTGLELYYNKCGFYPGGADCAPNLADWAALRTALTDPSTNIGISNIPTEPNTSRSYTYGTDNNRTSYVLAATLDDATNKALEGDLDGIILGVDCGEVADDTIYCVQL